MYNIAFDENVGLLEIRLNGFWTTETVEDFHRDYLTALNRYRTRFPNFPTLSDSRGFAVMSPEANDLFLSCARETAQRHSGKIAVVFQSRIAKMQAERIARKVSAAATRPRLQRFFTEMSEARVWALTPDLLDAKASRFAGN